MRRNMLMCLIYNTQYRTKGVIFCLLAIPRCPFPVDFLGERRKGQTRVNKGFRSFRIKSHLFQLQSRRTTYSIQNNLPKVQFWSHHTLVKMTLLIQRLKNSKAAARPTPAKVPSRIWKPTGFQYCFLLADAHPVTTYSGKVFLASLTKSVFQFYFF